MRVANSISILTEWIKNDKNIAPDDLADIIGYQVKESLNLNLLFQQLSIHTFNAEYEQIISLSFS